MDATTKRTPDGRIEIHLIVSEAELGEWSRATVTDDQTEADLDAEPAAPKYCCTCKNGDNKTIKANGDIDAFFKCLDRCGPDFSLSSGKCKD